jgi:hypothetical protein
MIWVSLALHAIPVFLFGRTSLVMDRLPAPSKVMEVFLPLRTQPSPPLPELIRPSTKLVVPSPIAPSPEPKLVMPPLTPLPDASAPIPELKPLPSFAETRAQLPPIPDTETYFTAAQVDRQADLLVPMESTFFSDDSTLEGALTLQIAVGENGKIDRFEILDEPNEANRRLRERLTEWFRDKKFNPARKEGKPVPSIFRFNFRIGRQSDPYKDVPSWPPPGYRPPLDARGNPVLPGRPPISKPVEPQRTP